MRIIKKNKVSRKMVKPKEGSLYYKNRDFAEIMIVAEKFADHVNKVEEKFVIQIQKIRTEISGLQKEINEIKKNYNI